MGLIGNNTKRATVSFKMIVLVLVKVYAGDAESQLKYGPGFIPIRSLSGNIVKQNTTVTSVNRFGQFPSAHIYI